MFKPSLAVRVIDEVCIGCRRCVNVCPSGALSMRGKLAVLEEPRCVGCMKCAEQCIPYQAIQIVPNPDAPQLGIAEADQDRPGVSELCARARLDPEHVACICTGTTVKEVAAAITQGITEPEDLTIATGVRALCGWLCLAPVLRLLEANGTPVERPSSDYRMYASAMEVSIWNLPAGVSEKYPEYRLAESLEAIEEGRMTEPMPWFPEIQPGRREA